MPNRMYVGNIPFSFTSEDLGKLFSEFGEVVYSQVVQDRETGRSRGFGFVEMATRDMFQAALEQGDGREVDGRAISVTEAREREARPAGGRPRPAGDRPYQGGGGGGGGGRPYSGGGGGAGGGGGGGGRDWGERSGGGGRGGERGGRDSDRGGRDHGRGGRDHERGGRGGERPKGPRRRDDDSDVADRDWGVGHIEREGDRDSRRSRFEGLPDDVD